MVVTLVQESPMRLCLRARPAVWVVAAILFGAGGGSFWIIGQGTSPDGEPVVVPVLWQWVAVGSILFVAVGAILETRVWCTLDAAAAQITIERGLFRRRKGRISFDRVERIAIRQRVDRLDDYNGPEALQPDSINLVLVVILKTGEELSVVERMPGGTEGASIVRRLEELRKGAPL